MTDKARTAKAREWPVIPPDRDRSVDPQEGYLCALNDPLYVGWAALSPTAYAEARQAHNAMPEVERLLHEISEFSKSDDVPGGIFRAYMALKSKLAGD